MKLSYRPAAPADKEAICDLFREMLLSIYGKAELTYPEGHFRRYFEEDKGDIIYVAEVDGQVKAFLSIEVHREEEEPFLYLDDLSVSPELRGQGIGSKLLTLAEEQAVSLEICRLFLHAEESNTRARKLYESFGYSVVGRVGSRLLHNKHLETNIPNTEGGRLL